MKLFNEAFETLVDEGQELLAFTIKSLVFKTREDLFNLIDYDNNLPYLEPFVFTHIHHPEDVSLDQLLFGYLTEEQRLQSTQMLLAGDGVAFLPEIGSLPIKHGATIEEFVYLGNHEFSAEGADFTSIPKSIHFLANTEIEILPHKVPQFDHYFFEWDNHKDGFSDQKASYEIVAGNHVAKVEKAIDLLKTASPKYFQMLEDTNKRIALFDNIKIRNFAVRDMHGMAFIGAIDEFSEVYYMEEIIHQCGHNLFNAATANLKDFFKIDPETHLGKYSNNPYEYRSIYSTLHGLFTIAARLECFQDVLQLPLTEHQRHELLGRLADLKRRFRTGLELVDVDEVYTEKGKALYKHIDAYCVQEFKKVDTLVEQFDYSNQTGPDFNYREFLAANALPEIPIAF